MTLPIGGRPVNAQKGFTEAQLREMRKNPQDPGWAIEGAPATDRVKAANEAGAGILWHLDGAAERGDRWGSEHL